MRILVLLGLLVAPAALAAPPEIKLKDGPARDLVKASCSTCHSLDYIQMNSVFLDRKAWDASVTKMVKAFGAPVKPEDVPRIVDYLVQNYGKADAPPAATGK